jgi:hypothetical protein
MLQPRPLPPLKAPAAEYDEIDLRGAGGSLAYHRSWRADYEQANETVRAILGKEEATAQRLRDFGFDVELNAEAAADELARGRDADAFVGGVPAQLKAVSSTSRRAWRAAMNPNQAFLIVLDALTQPQREDIALRRLRNWALENKDHTVWLLTSYESPPRLERISR